MANFFTVNCERNIFRGPFHLVGVPIAFGVEVMGIVMILLLSMTVTIDQVHRDRVLIH